MGRLTGTLGLLLAALVLAGCQAATIGDEGDYEDGAGDTGQPPDGQLGTLESSGCTRHRYLHLANWSYVAPLTCAGGDCKNACWGYQRRTSGFSCDYSAGQADLIKTRDGGGAFASYNEIKPLNAHDALAVSHCKNQSGHPLKDYVAWNGSGWNREGIAARVHFAELYGRQSEAMTHFSTWYGGYRTGYAPMINISPETHLSAAQVYSLTKKACLATRQGGWVGVYFYDGSCADGCGMAAWKRAAVIRAMNDCTAP